MQGVGVVLLTFAGWLFYCALHSYRPINMARAIITSPAKAKQILASADASVTAEAEASTGSGSANTASDSTAVAGGTGLNSNAVQALAELGYTIPAPVVGTTINT